MIPSKVNKKDLQPGEVAYEQYYVNIWDKDSITLFRKETSQGTVYRGIRRVMRKNDGSLSRVKIGHGWLPPEVVKEMKAEGYEYLYEDSLKGES